MASSRISGGALKRSASNRLSQRQKPLRSQYKILTRLRARLRNTNSTGSNTAAFISSSTRADSPSMDFLKSTGLGYRYTFLTLAPGRIMRKTSRGNTGGQHGADRTLVVGGVYGALTAYSSLSSRPGSPMDACRRRGSHVVAPC